jgi:hypothetical protein
MFRVEAAEESAVLCTVAGLREQAGAPVGLGETEQLRETAPLKPAIEVMVTVALADCPADTDAGVTADELKEKSGATTAWRRTVLLARKF